MLRSRLFALLVLAFCAVFVPAAASAAGAEHGAVNPKESPAPRALQYRSSSLTDGTLSANVTDDARFNIGVTDSSGMWDLSYRWPFTPGTSFSTVRIDGADYFYGQTGTLLSLPTNDGLQKNTGSWEIDGVEVAQTLELVPNPFSTTVQTVRIEYAVTNHGSAARDVGLRMMIDTELAGNDGAPFRIPGEGVLSAEGDFVGDAVPDSFQVFFSPTSADRVATGILDGYGATRPDRFVVAFWPSIWRTLYDFTPNGGPILSDSAYAVFWNPAPLEPDETRTYVTFYGPASLTSDAVPPLAATLVSPVELTVDGGSYSPDPFDVVLTVRNVSTAVAENVTVSLELPPELSLAEGEAEVGVGELMPLDEEQITWRVSAAPQGGDTTVEITARVGADGVADKVLSRSLFLPQLAATCDSTYDIASRVVRGRTCAEILAEANALSAEANPPGLARGAGRTSFSREETEVFFDAVECRTGVPAPLLRMYSFDEALGHYYANPYPRQFLEPCVQAWNQNGNMGAPELWQRYFGVACPAERVRNSCREKDNDFLEPWPLLAVGALDPAALGCDPTRNDCPSVPPSLGMGASWCTLFPDGDCARTPYRCTGAPADMPWLGGTPLPAMPLGAWQEVEPALVRVTLGDDRPKSDTFGLGLGQVTMYIEDIAAFDRVTVVRTEASHTGNQYPGYPKGAGRPDENGLGVDPLTEEQMIALLRDPQYNVLVAAQITVVKWQQLVPSWPGSTPELRAAPTECIDPDYGRIITLHEAPDYVDVDRNLRRLWICSVGSIKAGSGTCDIGGPALLTNTVNLDLDHYQIGRCFEPTVNNRGIKELPPQAQTPAAVRDCKHIQRFAFGYGCNRVEEYRSGSLPADDECRALIEEFQTLPTP